MTDAERNAMTDAGTEAVPPPDAAVPWRAVIVFVVAACVLAWLVALPLWLGEGLASPWAPLVLPLMMFTPLLAVLLVVFAFRVPARERLRFLGMWPLRPVGRVVGFTVAAVFVPAILVLLIALVSGALGIVRLDLVTFSGFAEVLDASVPEGTPLPPASALVALQLLMIPVGAIINSVLAFGEELGWRGWLVPALRSLGTWPALLLSGLVWGVWHAPVILLGYNFGRPDIVGLLLMIGGCLAWGVLLGWARLRTGSVWPAVVAHGSLNAAGGAVVLFVAAGESADMAVVGPLGVVSWGVLAIVVAVLAVTGQFRRQPALGVRD